MTIPQVISLLSWASKEVHNFVKSMLATRPDLGADEARELIKLMLKDNETQEQREWAIVNSEDE